jgi:hypothetical protein
VAKKGVILATFQKPPFPSGKAPFSAPGRIEYLKNCLTVALYLRGRVCLGSGRDGQHLSYHRPEHAGIDQLRYFPQLARISGDNEKGLFDLVIRF